MDIVEKLLMHHILHKKAEIQRNSSPSQHYCSSRTFIYWTEGYEFDLRGHRPN